ncbi:MAG TPA: zinc-ribbon domain-containing protein [Firmicutes bacterium]|nr:zinc-ribbon domain-containing protein [Bacillota bacterium]
MKCPECGTELKDGEKVCPNCGAKRPGYFNFIKRRQLREKETAELLDKSYIHAEDVSKTQVTQLRVTYRGKLSEEFTRSGIKAAISGLLMIGCIVVIALRQYTDLMDGLDTIGTAIVLLGAFILLFGNGASLANSAYYLARLNALKKQGVGVSKINYGKNPTAVYAGGVYEVAVSESCPACTTPTAMHIEQVQDMLVAVCNADRNHLYKLDKARVINAVMDCEFRRSGLRYVPLEPEKEQPENAQEEGGGDCVNAEPEKAETPSAEPAAEETLQSEAAHTETSVPGEDSAGEDGDKTE